MRRTAAITLVILGLAACSDTHETGVEEQMYDAPMRGHQGGGGGSNSTFVNWYIINHSHAPRYPAASVARFNPYPSQATMKATISARGGFGSSGGAHGG